MPGRSDSTPDIGSQGKSRSTSRKQREGSYCGRTSAGSGARKHVHSRTGDGHPASAGSAELEVACRRIRRGQQAA